MKMPPTAHTGGASVGNDRSRPAVTHITSRPRRASRLYLDYAALATLGKIVETTPITADVLSTGQFNVIPCKVVLKRLSIANLRPGGWLDFVDVNQPGSSARRNDSRRKSTVQSDILPERFSNVTKRTKPRRTGGEAVKEQVAAEKQHRHTISIVEESHDSIIALDESTDSSKILLQRRNTQNSTAENVPPQVRREATRNKNTTSDGVRLDKELEVRSSVQRKRGRPSLKRQNESVATGVSPPPVQRKRGRPSLKHQNESVAAGVSPPPVQRKRGRPSLKRQNESVAAGSSDVSPPPVQRKRGRPPLKRPNESVEPGCTDDSSPTEAPEHPVSIIELSLGPGEGTVDANAQPAVEVAETPPAIDGAIVSNQTSSKAHLNNPFKAIIVLVKRIVPALTEAGLKRLKYPELEAAAQEAKSSSVPAGVEKRPTTILPTRRPSRLTLSTKPQIVVSAPIAEDPEPAAPEPPGQPKVDANSNNLLPAGVGGMRGAFNKKPPPLKPPTTTLPLLIEEEGEGSGDVYEFHSLSQTSGEGVASRKKRGRKPKPRGEQKNPVGRSTKKKPSAPRAATRKGNHHPFGCTGKQLRRVLKNIGGGRVKSPATTAGRYVVNLELPKTPREPASTVGQRHSIGGVGGEEFTDIPVDAPPSAPLRAPNPTVEALKNGSSLGLPQTSTPINKPGLLASPATPPAIHNPASPWRLQDDNIVPRTSYMPRNKDMLPSYESLASEAQNILPRTSSAASPWLVTERRKPAPPPPQRTSSVDTSSSSTASPSVRTSGGTDFPGGTISERNFREFDRLCAELDASTELSRKLINSMRQCRLAVANNPPGRQQDDSTWRGAIAKLRQLYERSIRIVNRMYREMNDRSAGRRPPLSTEQQRTVETFSHSTDRFRTLIDELEVAMNDSHLVNSSPPSASTQPADGAVMAKAGQPKPPTAAMTDAHLENRSPPAATAKPAGGAVMSKAGQSKPSPLAPVEPARQPTQVTMNDSNLENRSPPSATTKPAGGAVVAPVKPAQQPPQPADVIELPNRTNGATRKPLMALNFVPLPQRSSPLMSPLAKTDGPVPLAKAANLLPDAGGNIRRELQYEPTAKETMASSTVTIVEPAAPVESGEPGSKQYGSIPAEQVPEVGANVVVELCDDTTMDNDLGRSDEQPNDDATTANGGQERDLFGFEEDISVESSQVETQVTLPMPLNISAETLKRKLQRTKRLIPKRSIFRKQPPNGAAAPSGRSSGPTRLPGAHLRVFSSPTKRPQTLREFIASTPRSDMSLLAVPKGGGPQASAGASKSTASPLEAPDVSAIEGNETVGEERADQGSAVEPEVVLFETPEASKINRSAHQRTYARIPRRRKKINIYLANVGLDDHDDDDEDEDNPVELSSGSESEETKKRKKKAAKKKPRRKPKPVEETKEFKEFVSMFNTMCEEVNRFEVIIE